MNNSEGNPLPTNISYTHDMILHICARTKVQLSSKSNTHVKKMKSNTVFCRLLAGGKPPRCMTFVCNGDLVFQVF